MDPSNGEKYNPKKDENADSSDDEKTLEEEAKEVSESKLTFTQQLPATIKNILVCNPGGAKALAKIIFHKNLVEIGKAETTYKEKTFDTVKFYYIEEHQLLLILTEPELKASFTDSIVQQIYANLVASGSTYHRVVILDTIYKTQYSTTDTGSFEGEDVPLTYYKTSFVKQDQALSAFLKNYLPAGVLNIFTGFGAQILIYAELNGVSAVSLTGVVDSHYVTSETLQIFTPVINNLLGMNSIKMEDIQKFPAFKDTLKEENSRGHNIFN